MHSIVHFPSPTLSLSPKISSFKAPLFVLTNNFLPPRFHGSVCRCISSSYNSRKPPGSSKTPKTPVPKSPTPKPKSPKSAGLKTPPPKPSTPTAKSNVSDSTEFLDAQDWSFLAETSSWINQNMATVVAAAQLEQDSKVVLCMGTERFVDYLCSVEPSIALSVLHYSLMELANIKENHDSVRCRQGDIAGIPPSWSKLDVVFINFLPALLCPLSQIFQALVKMCAPGARVIISDTQGRAQLNVNKQSYPGVINGDLPDKVELEKVMQGYPIQLVSFRDEPDFYLAVLKVA
ncbi:uncharacterized protein LOC131065660 [Cryptomeria japonica]|uniref:uncharacterized protein LOC131065660 n=1 Tax=Cryptomeria japonica TaxID=3369 RepID=UPI0027DAAE66|nr:uncharacterized protein LOC131065660 [Cryptomeria japonica]